MEPILIIGACAIAYYLFRKNGDLRFKIKDKQYQWIAKSYVDELLIKVEPHGKKILYSEINQTDKNIEDCYRLQRSISSEMNKYLSDILSENSFPRMKIHDLKNEILKIVYDKYYLSNASLYLALLEITSKSFNDLIERYDARKKTW